jgi:hypothetical protein
MDLLTQLVHTIPYLSVTPDIAAVSIKVFLSSLLSPLFETNNNNIVTTEEYRNHAFRTRR